MIAAVDEELADFLLWMCKSILTMGRSLRAPAIRFTPEILDDSDGARPFVGRATRPGHAFASAESLAGVESETRFITAVGASSPNGNTVSLEDQMSRAAETKINHDMALGVWRSALGILRASLGRGGR